ncbi:hypothetical protein J2Z66_007415 [Paenibacillus eucommiae]|uniref:DUF1186 domain-containing protein n=1 Tax=Paenibacillus eucommiae TaxID=1355755 RepID=A0ABS4J7I0_9BACL|nr:DUF1186 domain-containing protein [Paenibacillus eucommiae]MBP1995773.1 hypothetical protein [Paenibacillus eucommiae]
MEQLLQTIRYQEGKFPLNELQQIIERKEEAIPYLLEIMVHLKEDYKQVIDRPNRFDYIYAYYLLAQFQVKELYPILIDILSTTGDNAEDIFDDDITDSIGRILATVYNGDIDSLLSLIENEQANEYARGQGLIALVALVFKGELSREFVMDYLKQLMNGKIAEGNYYLNAEIVCCCDYLYPEEVYADIERMFEEDDVDLLIDMDAIDKTLTRTKEEVLHSSQNNNKFQLLTDTIKELEGWACFQTTNFKLRAKAPSKVKTGAAKSEPARNPAVKTEKIGRNDPCTCGSGKKYKNCCGK